MIKFGLHWPEGSRLLDIVFYMIRKPDEFIIKQGTTRADLYLEAHRILWPEDDQHRWFVLGMRRIVENQITVLMGSASSAKTHTMSCHALITFFVHPLNSFSMISSTERLQPLSFLTYSAKWRVGIPVILIIISTGK